jgi:AbrB family looped-hinge helix DNA binding protein
MTPIQHKIYGTTTMNDKGQVVIPAKAREELGLTPRMRLMIMRAPFGEAAIVIKTEVIEEQMQSLNIAPGKPNEENQ